MKRNFLSIFIATLYILRFFTGNIYGLFIIMSCIYYFIPLFSDTKFLTFSELIFTFDSIPYDFKALIISSLLTIIGFLIAFQSATQNWKDQLRANMRLDASREIDQIYNRATHLINKINIYADHFIKLGIKLEEYGLTNETLFEIKYFYQQTQQFIQDRAELANINITASSTYGRYATLLSCKNSLKNLYLINKNISNVTEKMWILTPNINFQKDIDADDFLRYYEYGKLTELSQQCKISSQAVSGLSGNITGQLNSKIMDINLWFVLSFIKLGPLFLDMQRSINRGEIIGEDIINKIEKNI